MFGKNIRMFVLSAFVIVLFSLSKAVWAQSPSTDLNYNEQTGILTIVGNIGDKALQKHNRYVTIQIFNPDRTDIGEETYDNVKEALYNFYQLTPDEDGGFTFSVKVEGISGYCLVRVRAADNESYFERTVFIASENEYNAARDEINRQTDAAGMRAALLKYSDLYNFTHSILETLLEKDEKGEFLNCISEYILSRVCSQPYTDFKDIITDLDMELHIWNILLESDWENQLRVLEEYAQYFAFTEKKAYNTQYIELPAEQKRDIMQLLKDAKPVSKPEFADKFFEAILLNRLNNMRNWQEAETVLSINSECIPPEIYEEYVNKTDAHIRIHKAVAAEKYKKFDRFITIFANAVNAKETGKDNQSGSGGSGHAGGSTNKGGGVYYPLVNTDTPSQEIKEEISYNDLDAVEWAKESIYKLSEMKILSGRGNGIFAPQENVTREEFVKMLVMAFQSYNSEAKCKFDDVNENDWYYPYVSSASEIGIAKGMDEKSFGAGRHITRQEMAAMCYRASMLTSKANFEHTDGEVQWTDQEDISDYARIAVAALYSEEIIQGTGDGKFEPVRNATRAEAAVMVYKLILFTR